MRQQSGTVALAASRTCSKQRSGVACLSAFWPKVSSPGSHECPPHEQTFLKCVAAPSGGVTMTEEASGRLPGRNADGAAPPGSGKWVWRGCGGGKDKGVLISRSQT